MKEGEKRAPERRKRVCPACGAETTEGGVGMCADCRKRMIGGSSERKRVVHIQHEGAEQEALFCWAELQAKTNPEIGLMFHIPNGGKRNAFEAEKLKRQGVKAGVPDIFLPVARGEKHGLFIEMKSGKNRTTDKQGKWLTLLQKQGYRCKVCYGWDSARDTVMAYLAGNDGTAEQ